MSLEKETLGFWERLMKLIEKYGYWRLTKVVMFVAFVIIVLLGSKRFVETYNFERQKEIMSQIMTENDQQRLEEHHEQMQKREDIKPYVKSLLQETLTNMGADRAFVIELHNGSSNAGGLPFMHCTMTYEEDRKTIESIDEDYQNLSLSRFNFPEYLHKHDIWIGKIDDFVVIDRKATSRMKNNGVTYLAIATIRTEENEIGYYGFTYCNNKEPKNTQEITEQMIHSVQELSKWLDRDVKN